VRELKNLMEAVVERENMLNALSRVVSNKGAAGVDAMSVDELKPYLQTHGWRYQSPVARGCASLAFPRWLTG
jgi:RNA-directed DNA polymerase